MLFGRSASILALTALISGAAGAQPLNAPDGGDDAPSAPVPYSALAVAGYGQDSLSQALAAARRGDSATVQADMQQMTDPIARKIALWAGLDAEGEQFGFYVADQARRDLAGWPRASHRQIAAEKTIAASGLDPARIVAWFQGDKPCSPEGAMALAAAYEQLGRRQDAQDLIRRWWRTRSFDLGPQTTMLTRFSDLLTIDDHIARVDMLLYGPQGPSTQALLPLLPPDQQALARARIALRTGGYEANTLAESLPPSVASSPGLAVDRAFYLQKHDLGMLALGLVSQFPAQPPNADAASRIWALRKQLINVALRAQQYQSAYQAATNTGLTSGPDYSEAEFYAGWIALSKLHDPALADEHFARIEDAGASPITESRALYWRGRAAEARGDAKAAQAFYEQGGRYTTAFYGQLAAEKAGLHTISLGHDPAITAEDRALFESQDIIKATRRLAEIGDRELFRTFVMAIADQPTTLQNCAQLVDLAEAYGDQDLAMRVARLSAQHGFVLPERGYPLRSPPNAPGGAEPAIVFGITRQESGFDPRVRSGVGARGMMQLMPATAQAVARRIGEPYDSRLLDDPDYNMRLGSAYMGHMIDDFSGSYVLATAAYNAGPGRPADWVGYCGDPRATSVDPTDFIECIPFSETRNYVMRVMEGAQVYRARLNGGSGPLTLLEDLKRGTYVYGAPAMRDSNPIAIPASTSADSSDPIGDAIAFSTATAQPDAPATR